MQSTSLGQYWKTLSVLMAGGSFLGAAQPEVPVPESLPSTTIEASRLKASLQDTAASSSVIDAEIWQSRQTRTLPDVLRSVPGVLVQKTAHGHGSPHLRGFTGRQNLLLVDGVRMNNATWRSGPVQYWNTHDLENVSSVEVLKSQGGVLYGSDAIGGTVNFLTRGTGFREAEGNFFHGRTHYRYESNSSSQVGRVETQWGQGGQWGVALGASLKDFGDIRSNALGRMKGTGYPEQAFDFKFESALDAASTFTLAHQYLNQDAVSRWHRTLANPGWQQGIHVTSPGTFLANDYDQERSLTYAKIDRSVTDSWVKRWVATLSFQRSQDSESQIRSLTETRLQRVETDTYGLDVQLTSEWAGLEWLYGLDWYHDEVAASGERIRPSGITDLRPLADDSSYDLMGLYVQAIWKVTDAWQIQAGARHAHAQADLGEFLVGGLTEGAKRDWSADVFELRSKYELNQQWSLFGGIAQSFRAPNLDDLTGNLTTQSGIQNAGSLGVEPEFATTYEIGVRHQSRDLSAQVSAYCLQLKDQIGPRLLGGGNSTTSNNDDGEVFGIEAEVAWQFDPAWTWRVWASAMDSQIETADAPNGEPLSRNAPFMGGTALRWSSEEARWWVEARLEAAARADRLSAANRADTQRIPSNGTPGFIVPSLHVGYRVNEHWDFTVALENLTDEDYRLHGSGQNEPGFNTILGVTARW